MKPRIYLVTIHQDATTLEQRLIRASSRAAAIRWAARDFIDAAVPSLDQLEHCLTTAGLKCETAGEDTETLDLSLEES